jgi:hypothetical protein
LPAPLPSRLVAAAESARLLFVNAKNLFTCLVLSGGVFLSGCDFDAPATAGPTRVVEEKLLGDWTSFDKDEQKEMVMHVRKLDDFNYVVSVEADIYRAFHSDLGKLALLSVQDLNSVSRKYVIYSWKTSNDGTQLVLRRVASDLISTKASGTNELQEEIMSHAQDPKILGNELTFTRKKAQP